MTPRYAILDTEYIFQRFMNKVMMMEGGMDFDLDELLSLFFKEFKQPTPVVSNIINWYSEKYYNGKYPSDGDIFKDAFGELFNYLAGHIVNIGIYGNGPFEFEYVKFVGNNILLVNNIQVHQGNPNLTFDYWAK